jgi:hypothetical protein
MTSSQKKPGMAFWATVVVVVLVVYVLSFGPVYSFAKAHPSALEPLLFLYRPLLLVASRIHLLHDFLLWWSGLFRG